MDILKRKKWDAFLEHVASVNRIADAIQSRSDGIKCRQAWPGFFEDTAFDELSCRDETTTGDEITSLKKGLGKLMLAFPVLMKEDEHDMVEWNWELGWDTVRQETQQTIPSVPGLREAERALFEAYWREVNRIRITIECRLDVQPNGHVQEKTAHSNARDEEMHRSRGSNSNLRIEQHADALDRIDTAT